MARDRGVRVLHPVECNALLHSFTPTIFVVLLVNVLIVVYLWRNRERLFKH
jgi:uncharacterized membrane protein (DUF2068 family)